MVLGLYGLFYFAQDHGVWPATLRLPASVDELIESSLRGSSEERRRSKTALDAFVEGSYRLALTGDLVHGQHYLVRGDELRLILPSCHLVWAKQLGQLGQRYLDVGEGALRRQVRENHAAAEGAYVLDSSKRERYPLLGGDQIRSVSISIPAAQEAGLDIEQFPTPAPAGRSTRGGAPAGAPPPAAASLRCNIGRAVRTWPGGRRGSQDEERSYEE